MTDLINLFDGLPVAICQGCKREVVYLAAFSGLCDDCSPKEEMEQNKRERIPAEVRWQVWERDNFTCQACGAREYLTIDHIVPVSKGGANQPDNYQTLCGSCNSRKKAK